MCFILNFEITKPSKMKNAFLTVLFVTSFLVYYPLLAQEDAWQRVNPTPQEHDLRSVCQIPESGRIAAAGAGATIMFSDTMRGKTGILF